MNRQREEEPWAGTPDVFVIMIHYRVPASTTFVLFQPNEPARICCQMHLHDAEPMQYHAGLYMHSLAEMDLLPLIIVDEDSKQVEQDIYNIISDMTALPEHKDECTLSLWVPRSGKDRMMGYAGSSLAIGGWPFRSVANWKPWRYQLYMRDPSIDDNIDDDARHHGDDMIPDTLGSVFCNMTVPPYKIFTQMAKRGKAMLSMMHKSRLWRLRTARAASQATSALPPEVVDHIASFAAPVAPVAAIA
jgi:hypothetical protein